MDVRWGRNLIDVLIGRNKPSLLPLHLWSLALSERLTIPVLLRGQTWDLHLHPNKQSQNNPVKAENSVLGHIAIQRLLRFTGSNQSIFFLPAQRAPGAASKHANSISIWVEKILSLCFKNVQDSSVAEVVCQISPGITTKSWGQGARG